MATTVKLHRSKTVFNVDSLFPQSNGAAEPHSRTAVVSNVWLVIAIAHATVAALIEPIQSRHAPVTRGGSTQVRSSNFPRRRRVLRGPSSGSGAVPRLGQPWICYSDFLVRANSHKIGVAR